MTHPKYHQFSYLRNIAFSALCFLLLAGCAAKRNSYNVPVIDLPKQYAKAPVVVDVANFKNTTTRSSASSPTPAPSSPLSAALAEWWRLLGSQELNGLMDRALANNPDLRIAVLRIAQSKARLDQAGADKVPVITMPAQVKNEYPDSGIGRGNANGTNKSRITHQISLRGDWRPDIWGETYSLYESAEFQLLRATYQRDDMQRNVVADVAVNYMEYLSLNDRLRVARETEKSLSEMLAAVNARLEVGDATITDMEQQKAAVYSVKATIPVLEQQREVVLNRLASLVGSVPVALRLSDRGLNSTKFPSGFPGLPSALLLRRPDVRAVEARLLAADADIDVARTRVLPPLDLTAQVGYGSMHMSQLFMPQALFWSAIANLSVTIFDSGKRSKEVEFSQAVHEELLETYVRVIYDAVREVDDSLSMISFMGKRLEAQGVSADSSLRAWNFSQEAFMAGAVDYLVVLDTQRTYQRNLDDWYNVRMDRYRGLIDLFRALGGGVPVGDVMPGEGARPAPLADEIDYGAIFAETGTTLKAEAILKAENAVARNQPGGIVAKSDTAAIKVDTTSSIKGSEAGNNRARNNIANGNNGGHFLKDSLGLTLTATLPGRAQTKWVAGGVDWAGNSLHSGATHWLVELSGVHDRGAVLPAWRDLRARFPQQIESRTLLPHRQGQVNAAGKERASWYRLFIATFTDKKMAEDFCATLRAEQQRCGVVSALSLAGKGNFVVPLEQSGSAASGAVRTQAEQGTKAAAEAAPIAIAVPASVATTVVAETPKPQVNAGSEAEVLKSVQGWVAAWSNKNVRDYLVAYTHDFKPDGMNRDTWKKQRMKLVSTPKAIEIALSNVSVSMLDEGHATVSFTQNYRSDSYHDQVEKTLQLVKQSAHWLIAEERVVMAAKTGAKAQAAAEANQALVATPPGKRHFDGVDWSDQQFWLVKMSDLHDRRAITAAWLDLLTRFPVQMKNRAILPRRQGIMGDAGEERASQYQLFIAKFPEKQMAEEFCAILRAGQQRCGVVSSLSLAGKEGLNAPSVTDKGDSGQDAPGQDTLGQNTKGSQP